MRQQRKLDHVHIAVNAFDGPVTTGFENIHLLNNSIPELNMREIDLTCNFVGKKLSYPLLLNAITGGTEQAYVINEALARMALKYGLAMAVGSQTIAVDSPNLTQSFQIVRQTNPDGPIIANVGATSPVETALQAVEMISADALQLHFNIPQELAMPEGDRNFNGILDNVRRIVDNSPVPVIAKEVGFGFSRECAAKIYSTGIKIIDCGGQGGTNFIVIEDKRGGNFNQELDDWGIPTAISLAEILSLQQPLTVIVSGGIRTAADAVKALAMGADMVGMAGPWLKILINDGIEELERRLGAFLYRLEAIFLMSGSKNMQDLRQKPLLIMRETAERLRLRGIDPQTWAKR